MRPVRRVPSEGACKPTLYLSFDDGPDATSTPAVLDLLAHLKVRATFFVVAEKAARERGLLARIQRERHAVGNHSMDHGYRVFFRGRKAILEWIRRAESLLQAQLGGPTVGFRPPAGVRTPELGRALRELNMPLILWKTRYFDTTFAWTPKRALGSLERAHAGDIVLLHDRQSSARLPGFLKTLEVYVEEARRRGYNFDAINPRSLPHEHR